MVQQAQGVLSPDRELARGNQAVRGDRIELGLDGGGEVVQQMLVLEVTHGPGYDNEMVPAPEQSIGGSAVYDPVIRLDRLRGPPLVLLVCFAAVSHHHGVSAACEAVCGVRGERL